MDTIKSFKGYGKVDERDELEFRRKTRRRLVLIGVSAVVLIAVVIGAVVGTVIHNRNSDSSDASSTSHPPSSSAAASLKTVCSVTQYPESCFSSIQSLDRSNTSDPKDLFKLSLQAVSNELNKISSFPKRVRSKINDERVQRALLVCEEVISDAIERLSESISAMDVKEGGKVLNVKKIDDLKTWLSASITDQDTCLDAIEEMKSNTTGNLFDEVKAIMKNSTEFASNSLAIVAKLLVILVDLDVPIHRKLLGVSGTGFPNWVQSGDRRLLQDVVPVPPNVTVAKDGSGDVETIGEAVGMVPKKSKERFVIYVKEGEYVENVNLEKHDWNVMMYGDGKTKTIISGSKNFIDGTPTFSTATFAVAGRGFIAKDIAFRNTAGAAKHQAVAMRSGSDQSVFYKCSFEGFQDTLYAHSNRQFYRDCDITGTIDFIFGNSAVVFQGCNIMPRQPLPNQFVTITAQGKKDVNENTGISIQKCVISALDELKAKTYLGRPWKEFSTTVIMQTNIQGFLQPEGWIPWVNNVDPPSTIFYGEYQNTGPGAGVDQRVKWAGYKPVITEEEASKFTVQSFIGGSDWLPMADVTFDLSL